MASEGKHRKPDSSGFRIWPGVTLIAVCCFLVFLAVYVIAYRANLIPLPDYVEALLRGEANTAETEETRNDKTDALLPPQETDSHIIYSPMEEEPEVWFASHTEPSQYYQRLRIIYQYGGRKEEVTAELYRRDGCWKLIRQEKGAEAAELYLCDGESLYREKAGQGIITGTGSFIPENILGIPALSVLQQAEEWAVSFPANGKELQFSCELAEDRQCTGLIAVDNGLITDMQIRQDGEVLLVMYTELFDMTPAAFGQTDFFTIPENGGTDR